MLFMKLFLIFFFLILTSKIRSQNFGTSQVLIYPSPIQSSDMQYYNWYKHPEEKNIYIISFEKSSVGFSKAFEELQVLLIENNLDFSDYMSDHSEFHSSIKKKSTFEELHDSVIAQKSKIFRTWKAGSDYLTLLLNFDTYLMILGTKNSQINH